MSASVGPGLVLCSTLVVESLKVILLANGGSAVLTNSSCASPCLAGEYTVVSSNLGLISLTCRASDSVFPNLLLEVCWDLGAALASA